MKFALTNCDIYTGFEVITNSAIIIEDNKVNSIQESKGLPKDVETIDLGGLSVSPGFVDLQVNGGGDVLFNDDPSVEQIQRIRDAHLRLGTTDFLPTYITGPVEGMRLAAGAVQNALADGLEGILGIHFEGPVLNPEKAGVHDRSLIRHEPIPDLLEVYSSISRGCTLVTLAPEMVSSQFISDLRARGVHVAAGHTSADAAQMKEAVGNGVDLGTHVWNAMSPLSSREPGAVGALLRDDSVTCSFIADGFHLSFDTLMVSLRSKPQGKAILVTDAMNPVGGVLGGYKLGPYDVKVVEGRCITEDGTLAGSALDLATAVRNCIQKVGVSKDEALRMATLYPARYLGLENSLGRIAPGQTAHLAIFDNEINVRGVVFGGEYLSIS